MPLSSTLGWESSREKRGSMLERSGHVGKEWSERLKEGAEPLRARLLISFIVTSVQIPQHKEQEGEQQL